MDRDLKRRIARQNKANMKSDTPDKESATAESSWAADIVEGTA